MFGEWVDNEPQESWLNFGSDAEDILAALYRQSTSQLVDKWKWNWGKPVTVQCQGDHKPGKLRDFCEYGKLGAFCATSGKNYNKQNNFSTIEYLHLQNNCWLGKQDHYDLRV